MKAKNKTQVDVKKIARSEGRNIALYEVMLDLKKKHMSLEDIKDELVSINNTVFDTPIPAHEIVAMIVSQQPDIDKPDSEKSVEELQADRGAVYGKYPVQAEFVGKAILSWIEIAESNGRKPDPLTLGSMAYMFLKQSRLAASPEHIDSIKDLASYADLHQSAMGA